MEWSRLLLFCLVVACSNLLAQKSYYLCYFLDKPAYTIQKETPLDYYSQRSIDRRAKNGVDFTIQDFPVHQAYLDTLEDRSISSILESRWLNATFVLIDSDQKNQLERLPFVDSLEWVSDLVDNSALRINKNNSNRTQIKEIGNHFIEEELFRSFNDRGKGVKVAVFDAGFMGVNTIEPFQNTIYQAGFNLIGMDTNVYQYDQHGTQVLSIMGSVNGLTSSAEYELYVTELELQETRREQVFWLKAAELADSSGVDLIQSSLGYSIFHDNSNEDYSFSEIDGKTSIISRAAKIATQKGLIVVSSAGNDGNVSGWGKLTMPADVEEVISVGAVNSSGNKASFSSEGPTADGRTKPDIMGMGVGVPMLDSAGDTIFDSGTSFSAPAIASVCVWLLQTNANLTAEEVKRIIEQAGDIYPLKNSSYGHGILDFSKVAEEVGLYSLKVENGFDYYIKDRNLVITTPFEGEWLMNLYSIDGQLNRIKKIVRNETTIDLSNLSNGILIVKITGEGEKGNKSFLISNF